MFSETGKISRKIFSVLLVFFLIATAAIGMTLVISWQLEGVAAAINDAGSQRMRTYRIGHLMARGLGNAVLDTAKAKEIAEEVDYFETVLGDLQLGDSERPLSGPRNGDVQNQLTDVQRAWRGTVRPLVLAYLSADQAQRALTLDRFDRELEPFVHRINQLVLVMERSYVDDTNLLRTMQVSLVLLAILGTIILIRFFIRLVIQPVSVLHAGMQRMISNDLAVRLPVDSDDELGGLAHGFNQMAEHLQLAYSTLEERVEAETRSLAQRNHELGILYTVTSFLSEPLPQDALCQGFLDQIKFALGADAGAVRLYMAESQKLNLITHDGLSDSFLKRERELNCGECLCGEVIQSGMPAVFDTVNPPVGMKLGSCIREGFATATAFNIVHGKRRLGVYNLYFLKTHPVSAQEKSLLETIGQHLGVAIENQRLRSREKELAVFEERNLLAQELHDSIAQGLAFLNIQVQLLQDSLRHGRSDEAMQTAGQLREGVQESYDDVRELLVHFRARVLQSDLDTAIANALVKFEGQTGIATELAQIGGGTPLAPADETQVMHIVQESLSNIRKHAQANLVKVSVSRNFGAIEIEVQDDGVGFDTVNEPNVQSDRHVGLKIMRERAHRVGGECQITSKVGEGTRVRITLPKEARKAV
ncbi:MAG: type IV pili methyl-accepting chemotaxis transducer N-terminal domain-containing protein [Azonexus sp.]|nr:type IV pili methyl-accepting chemotaxis transducer N-terminal domain-containing protein [Azonexus sp.]MDZ4315420.1 type IV pili methyl-accepting chemotaxis transducer N-terminal domain-containing protein [Azonexus sp.]